MPITTASGTKVYIGPVRAPTVDTAAEYAALAWVEIKEVESISPFGDVSALQQFASLGDQRVRNLKGARNAGSAELVVGRDPYDAGQTAVKAAEKTKFEYAFKIVAADKADANDTDSIYYFGALVTSVPDNYGGNDNVVRTTFNLAINTDIIEVPATVVP